MFVVAPIVIEATSPRTTHPYQMLESRPIFTAWTTAALFAT
jgi:hypothetical protein